MGAGFLLAALGLYSTKALGSALGVGWERGVGLLPVPAPLRWVGGVGALIESTPVRLGVLLFGEIENGYEQAGMVCFFFLYFHFIH